MKRISLLPIIVLALFLVSEAQAATHSISLTWDASATPGVTYNVKRSTVAGGLYTVQVTGGTALTYTDNGLAPQVTFCYVVSATLAGVESMNSNEACGTTPADAVVPGAPKNTRITKTN